jgi:hypothetical protein
MAGNTLGARAYFRYVSDSGALYNILTDVDLGTAGGLVEATTGAPTLPRRFRVRGVWAEGTVDGRVVRKFIPCADTAAIYDTDVSTAVTVDGVNFITTGRIGERASFPRFNVTP